MEWFQVPRVREILEGFTQYLARGKQVTLKLQDGSEPSNLKETILTIYPNGLGGRDEQTKWSLTRAEIAHELGHLRFTKRWPSAEEARTPLFPLLYKLVEDNRIEYLMVQKEHMARVLLPKRSARLLAATPPTGTTEIERLLLAALRHSSGIRCNQPVAPYNGKKWEAIKKLLNNSFHLSNCEASMKMAREIEDIILDLDPDEDHPKLDNSQQSAIDWVRRDGEDHACWRGENPQAGEGDEGEEEPGEEGEGQLGGGKPGKGETGEEEESWSSKLKTDAPDVIFKDAKEHMAKAQRQLNKIGMNENMKQLDPVIQRRVAHGAGEFDSGMHLYPADPTKMLKRVNQILPVFLDAFKTVPPLEVADLASSGGRLSLRDYLVDETRPFLSINEPKKDMMDLAIRVVCDISGSMRDHNKSTMVALFAMALHRAAQAFNVHYEVRTAPLNILLAGNDIPVREGDENLMAIIQAPGPHEDMGLILEQHCQELLERPEGLKMILCLHDGQSNDHTYLTKVVKHYRKKGIRIIGIGFAGNDSDMLRALENQFANDFLIPVDLTNLNVDKHLTNNVAWEKLRDIPQKLARVIRNFRRGG